MQVLRTNISVSAARRTRSPVTVVPTSRLRPEPYNPAASTKPDKPTSVCFGDLHRAQLQVGLPETGAIPRYETTIIEKWADRKKRREAEKRIADTPPPPKRGGWPKKPRSLVRAVRADFRAGLIVRVIAKRNKLNPGQVARICADMPKRPHWRKRRTKCPTTTK